MLKITALTYTAKFEKKTNKQIKQQQKVENDKPNMY